MLKNKHCLILYVWDESSIAGILVLLNIKPLNINDQTLPVQNAKTIAKLKNNIK